MRNSQQTAGRWFPFHADSADAWFTPGRFAALLAGFFFCVFPQVLLGLETFVFQDYGLYSYPVAWHWRESFWRGEIPLWNPLSNCGTPFLAQWSTMVLYPPTLLYMVFPLTWALPLFSIAHLWLGGMGMYFLARRWTGNSFPGAVAGLVFAYNGLTINSLQWQHYEVAIGWMPWIVLASEQALRKGGRWTLWAIVPGTMQMLSGMPEIIMLTWVLVLGMVVRLMWSHPGLRLRICGRFTAQVIAVSALCGAQLLPFLELFASSARAAGFADATWSMPGTGLANLLVPLFHTFLPRSGVVFQYGQFLTSSYYLGIALVWLCLLAFGGRLGVRFWGLVGVSLTCLLLAMGDEGWLFPLVSQFAPVIEVARYPVKFLYLFALTAPLTAAFGVAACLGFKNHVSGRILWGLGGGLGVVMALLAWFGSAYAMPMDVPGAVLKSAITRMLWLALFVGGVWAASQCTSIRRGVWLRIGLLMIIWLDVRSHMPPQMPSIPSWPYDPELARRELKLEPFPKHGHSRLMSKPAADVEFHFSQVSDRVADLLVNRAVFFANANLLDEVAKVNGFYSLYLRWHEQLIQRFYGRREEGRGLRDFMGVSQFTDPADGLSWKPVETFLPMITGGQQVEFLGRQETMDRIFSAEFQPREVVCLPLESKTTLGASPRADVKVIAQAIAAHLWVAEVEADAPAVLVASQTFHSGWKVRVNGKPAAIHHANHAFQAVAVPAGISRVEWYYADTRFIWGGAFSLTGLLGWWLMVVRGARCDTRSKPGDQG